VAEAQHGGDDDSRHGKTLAHEVSPDRVKFDIIKFNYATWFSGIIVLSAGGELRPSKSGFIRADGGTGTGD